MLIILSAYFLVKESELSFERANFFPNTKFHFIELFCEVKKKQENHISELKKRNH